ncbi:hypothetical protein J6590_058575 [Homalodisca vitripennis]|nr:hypothetical protein J6590_058575 [Homalodisca vitripennis]
MTKAVHSRECHENDRLGRVWVQPAILEVGAASYRDPRGRILDINVGHVSLEEGDASSRQLLQSKLAGRRVVHPYI